MPAFLAPVDYAVGVHPTDVKAGDFNSDGHPDLATANRQQQRRQRAPGQRRRHVPAGSDLLDQRPYPLSLAVGDFNRDGKLDLATANDYVPGNDGVNVLLGQGDGTFVHAAPPTRVRVVVRPSPPAT